MRSQLRLLRYAVSHWRGLSVVLAAMVLSIALEILRPWPTKLLVDQVLGGQSMPAPVGAVLTYLPGPGGREGLLLWVCIGTVGLFLAGSALSMVSTVTSVALGQRMTYDLGADLFLHLQRLSLRFHSRRPVGDMSARITGDAYCVQVLLIGAFLPLLQSAVSLVAMFAVMWRLEPHMTLLALGVAPFLVLAIRLCGKCMKDRAKETRDLEGRMMSVVQQSLTAVPAIQAFGRETTEHGKFRSFAAETVAAYRRSTLAGMWFKLLVGLVTSVGAAGIMWMGAAYVLNGRMTVGTILVFLSYLASLYAPLNAMTYTASTVQAAAANTDRVMEIFETAIEVEDRPGAKSLAVMGTSRMRTWCLATKTACPCSRIYPSRRNRARS